MRDVKTELANTSVEELVREVSLCNIAFGVESKAGKFTYQNYDDNWHEVWLAEGAGGFGVCPVDEDFVISEITHSTKTSVVILENALETLEWLKQEFEK